MHTASHRPPISHLVFDVGQVLVRWDPEIPYRRLIPDADSRRWFLETVCSPAWNLEQDRGRSWLDAELEATARHPNCVELIRAYRLHWHEMVPGALEETVQLMREAMANGVDVTLLSNFAADTFAEAIERFPFLDEARGRTVSAEVGLVKPEPAIYRHHQQAFGLDPERTLFVDDLPRNIDAARSLGWRGHVFTDPAALRDALAQVDLIPG